MVGVYCKGEFSQGPVHAVSSEFWRLRTFDSRLLHYGQYILLGMVLTYGLEEELAWVSVPALALASLVSALRMLIVLSWIYS